MGDEMSNEVKISVRSLVEYVFRSGSIESGFRTNSTLTEGTKVHQKVQKTYKETDQKEVYVKLEVQHDDLLFIIDGRCDGLIFLDNGEVMVDEIKSTSRDLSQITEDTYPVHWAQAIFYAYIYAKDNNLNQMNVQLTYVQKETKEQRKFQKNMDYKELEIYVLDVIQDYIPYATLRTQHQHERNQSIKELSFPFPMYREGQRKLAKSVYKTILDEKNLFAKASTGIGKTISTTFPTVKAVGEGLLQRIFYLTAKTITRTAAEEAFILMEDNGLKMKAVTITAKDKVCFKEETICQKEHCEFADGYYDRINGAILNILTNETLMSRSVIEFYARKHRVCPFEFSLDLAYASDAIICDYNYIFDPRVSLKRLFEEHKKQTALLIDESHNLVDRAREMYSAELKKSSFLQLQREYKGTSQEIHKTAKAINEYLLEIKKQCNENMQLVTKELDEELIVLLDSFINIAEKELLTQSGGELQQQLLDIYFLAQSFVRIAKLYDERYITFVEYERSEVYVKLLCLDPSHLLQQMGKGFRSKIFFSATLSPFDYYRDMLGGSSEDYAVSIPSPFARENVEVLIQPLSTRYRDRERSIEPIGRTIQQLIKERPGNYLVFLPSYQYMNVVYDQFVQETPNIETIVQNIGMAELERESFLATFQSDNKNPFVGFAVLGGIFSEGVDLKGDRLNGVIVVGVGLPQIGLERNVIKDYFDSIGRNGYEYAYVFPGMNKVLQAGGRLIRSENDRGTIVLIDDRFLYQNYQALLPYEWQNYKVIR
jgi:DNA excision repair protein ERCC-2